MAGESKTIHARELMEEIGHSEDQLVEELHLLAKEAGFTRYTPTDGIAWKRGVRRVSQVIIRAAKSMDELGPVIRETDYERDPLIEFGIEQAIRHRERGVDPPMLLGLLKLWRLPYITLARKVSSNQDQERISKDFIDFCFDRIEIGMSIGWAREKAYTESSKFSATNRALIEEKNKLQTLLNSLHSPVFLIDSENRLDGLNPEGLKYLRKFNRDFGGSNSRLSTKQNIDESQLLGRDAGTALPWLNDEIISFNNSSHPHLVVEKAVDTNLGTFHIKAHLSRMDDFSGGQTGAIVNLEDVTSERQSQADLKRHQEDLEKMISQRTAELRLTNERLVDEVDNKRTALEALRQSEYRYRMIVETSSEGIWTLDQQGITTFVNEQMAHMLGYSPQEMQARSFMSFMDDEWKEKSLSLWNRRVSGVVEQHDFKFKRKDGNDFWALLSASPIIDETGEFAGALAMVTDINERREAEDSLKNNLQFVETLLRTIPSPVFYKDDQGRYLGCNQAFLELMGTREKDIVGKTVYDVAPAHLADTYAKKDAELFRDKGVQIYEGKTVDGKGVVHDVIFYKSTFPDSQGGVAGIIGVALDITDRKRDEKNLEELNRTLQTTLSTVPIGIGLAKERRIIWVNRPYIEMFGFDSPEESNGLDARTLYATAEDYERVGAVYEKLTDGSAREIDINWRKRDGSTFTGRLAMKALAPDNPVSGVIFAISDISWRKRAEELILQAERLKAVGELATGVAHNFNNLLQIVVGGSQIALSEIESGNTQGAVSNIEQILESAKMGSETVKRLQDFARIRREDVNSRGRVFDLSKTVESAIEMSKPWWKTSPEKEGYSIRLIKRLTPEALIEGQENEIFEVVTNLIKNASEALPSGGNIRVAVTRLDSQVRLLVEDNGIGIAEEHKNHIFQPFWTTKGYAGTGMGLSTCYGIVKRHQGEINVESNIGQGATFIISFPAAQPERSTEAPPQRSEPDVKYNILVIDDMPAVLKQLDKGLSRVGQTVFTAKSGARGLDIINETHVDAVVCDLGMPDMNGLQVARRIKALYEERGTKRPLFVILTGWGGQIDRSEANRDNGVDLVLEKPIPSNQLLQRIIEMAGA